MTQKGSDQGERGQDQQQPRVLHDHHQPGIRSKAVAHGRRKEGRSNQRSEEPGRGQMRGLQPECEQDGHDRQKS